MRTEMFKRLGLVATGGFISFYGWTQLGRGVAVYANGYHQTMYSATVIAAGGFFALCGLVPTSFVAWLIKVQMPTAKRRDRKGQQADAIFEHKQAARGCH